MGKNENPNEAQAEASYPYYDLESCLVLATSIKELGGSKASVRKSQLAEHVGLAESTPSFFQKLSAGKVFGIFEGRGAYNLTELGRRYFYPQSDQDQVVAKIQMVSNPPAFRSIIDRFDGEALPKTEIMGNIFHNEMGIPDSWKDRVAQIFNRSAVFAGIIDSRGFLRYDSSVHTKPQTVSEKPASVTNVAGPFEPPPQPVVPNKPIVVTSSGTVWSFGEIRVQTPEPLSPELWSKLNAYIQILKPLEKDLD